MMQTNSCKGTVYVVKEKDSLYKIAKAHGVRVKDIMYRLEMNYVCLDLRT